MRRGLLVAALSLLLWPSLAGAQRRRLEVGLTGGPVPHAAVRLPRVASDPSLRQALASGLPLRFRFRLELWEKRSIDRLRGTHRVEAVLLEDPLSAEMVLTIGRTRTRHSAPETVERTLEALFSGSLQPANPGRYYYLSVLEVETLSLSDLEELERWLRSEARPAVGGEASVGRAVESGVRRAVVRMMRLPTRRYEARSRTFARSG